MIMRIVSHIPPEGHVVMCPETFTASSLLYFCGGSILQDIGGRILSLMNQTPTLEMRFDFKL